MKENISIWEETKFPAISNTENKNVRDLTNEGGASSGDEDLQF